MTQEKHTMVVALGGNALGKTCAEQKKSVAITAKSIADLIEAGHKIVLTHGNGPQVGLINQSFIDSQSGEMPFPECGAMSQGYIGYHLQNALQNELTSRNIQKDIAALITRVLVDENDPAFNDPSKPIGRFYDKSEAHEIAQKYGYVMAEDANRGYRRVVPSPKPIDIIEKNIISSLVDKGFSVIAAGGGGVPVVTSDSGAFSGVAAVVDKDFSSALLATLIDADLFLIITAVDAVCLNYGKADQQSLSDLTLEDIDRYLQEGHFAKGSMLPKILAASEFVQAKKESRKAIITSPDKIMQSLNGESGTSIHA